MAVAARTLVLIRRAAHDLTDGRAHYRYAADAFAALARDVLDVCDLLDVRTVERDQAREECDRQVHVLAALLGHHDPAVHRATRDACDAHRLAGVEQIPPPGSPEAEQVAVERRWAALHPDRVPERTVPDLLAALAESVEEAKVAFGRHPRADGETT